MAGTVATTVLGVARERPSYASTTCGPNVEALRVARAVIEAGEAGEAGEIGESGAASEGLRMFGWETVHDAGDAAPSHEARDAGRPHERSPR